MMIQLVHPDIEAYAEAHTSPRPPLFDELRTVTYETMKYPEMQVGKVEGTLLKFLVALSGARRVVEIGTFTGFSALCMAEALPDDGELVTCDIDPAAAKTAQDFFDRSPHGKKIRLALGDALDTLRSLPRDPPIDLAFLDADKERYALYYEELVPRLRRGGLLVADNTLWSGRVLSPRPGEETDRAIVAFNRMVTEDPRVENVLLSVRDGVMLARKVAS
jgi:caffeoyl-CoA O-methyltransferase